MTMLLRAGRVGGRSRPELVGAAASLSVLLGDLDLSGGFYAGPYAAQPAYPDGFLANDTDITNPAATYVVWDTNLPEGEFTWFAGGGYQVSLTCPPGQYQFRYKVLDLDGQGTDSSLRTASVTVT